MHLPNLHIGPGDERGALTGAQSSTLNLVNQDHHLVSVKGVDPLCIDELESTPACTVLSSKRELFLKSFIMTIYGTGG